MTFKFSRGAKAGSEHQAHSSRPGHGPWRQFWIFLGLVALIGFVLNEVWGRERLQHALEAEYTRPLKLGNQSIIHASRSWQADGIFGDDVALIGLELNVESKEELK